VSLAFFVRRFKHDTSRRNFYTLGYGFNYSDCLRSIVFYEKSLYCFLITSRFLESKNQLKPLMVNAEQAKFIKTTA
jgi:hypothetical protein